MNGDNKRGPEFYRRRAAEMMELADRALTERLRQSFLALAANWSRLADEAEKGDEEEKP